MPCFRCGVRQVDPVRGHSPWQRGVRGDQQVLVCPDCQAAPGLAAELDHCRRCGSVRLVRRLGEVECRACGFVAPPEVAGAGPAGTGAGGTAPGLAEEVALALERVLGRGSGAPSASASVR
jgi:ribosomal protein L40E